MISIIVGWSSRVHAALNQAGDVRVLQAAREVGVGARARARARAE